MAHVVRVGHERRVTQIAPITKLPEALIAHILLSSGFENVCDLVKRYCVTYSLACGDETFNQILKSLNLHDANQVLNLEFTNEQVLTLFCTQLYALGDRRNRAFENNRARLGHLLRIAVERNHSLLAYFLLKRNASTGEGNDKGMLPIHYAMLNANLGLIRLLHAGRAALNAPLPFRLGADSSEESFKTPMMILIKNVKADTYSDVVACVAFMLEHLNIADINVSSLGWVETETDMNYLTWQNALYFAIDAEKERDDPKMVKMFLNKPGVVVLSKNMTNEDILYAFRDEAGKLVRSTAYELVSAKLIEQGGDALPDEE